MVEKSKACARNNVEVSFSSQNWKVVKKLLDNNVTEVDSTPSKCRTTGVVIAYSGAAARSLPRKTKAAH